MLCGMKKATKRSCRGKASVEVVESVETELYVRRRFEMDEGTACAILLELQEIKRILQQIAAKMA